MKWNQSPRSLDGEIDSVLFCKWCFGFWVGKRYNFSHWKNYCKNSSLWKGETFHFFLCQKEKSSKERTSDASVRGGKPAAWPAIGSIPQSPLVSLLSRKRESESVPEGTHFAWRKKFRRSAVLWFSLIVWWLFCRTDRTTTPPKADFIPSKYGKMTAVAFHRRSLGAK